MNPELKNNFTVLKKCNGKFDSLLYEMLFIRKRKPNLNIQTDSLPAKVFVWDFTFVIGFAHIKISSTILYLWKLSSL